MFKTFGKKHIIFLLIAALVLALALFFYPLRSYLAMSVYSRYNYKSSVMKDKGFSIDMKGGLSTAKKDWYPFINIYDTSYEFSNYTGEDLSLTVLYNFGAFNGTSSQLYDESSDYFAAYYGAYAICDNENKQRKYGFNSEGVSVEEIAAVPIFDYKYLVIKDLGCENLIFDILNYETDADVSYIGYDNWVRLDAVMKSNSPSHQRKDFKFGYIQYGRPLHNENDDFYEITLFGRMYARYFEEYGCTIVLYVMGANEDIIDECDSEILRKTEISEKEQ